MTTVTQIRNQQSQSVTVQDVINKAQAWETEHAPFDRGSKLNLFQFVINEGTGGALVPFSNALEATGPRFMPNSINLSAHALDQLMARVDYPKKLYPRLAGKLNIYNLNWLIQQQGATPVTLRIQDGNLARAVLGGSYAPFDDLEFLQMVAPYLPSNAKVRWEFKDDLTTHLSISFPNTATELVVGDVVEAGIHLSNSEVGIRSVTVAGYVFRLRCSNGQVGSGDGDMFRFRHTGDHDRMGDSIRSSIESTMLESQKVIQLFKKAMQTEIDKPFDFMEKVAKEGDMSQEMFKSVMEGMMNEDYAGTLMNVSMGCSRASQSYSGEESYELQRLSTKVLSLPVGA